MYNADQKRRYISSRGKDMLTEEGHLEQMFNRIEQFENRLGKDLSTFTVKEIMEVYKMLNVSSVGVLKVLNSYYSSYTSWCLKENLVSDNQNHFLEMTLLLFEKCINKNKLKKYIWTRDEIYQYVDALPNARDKFCILSVFELGVYKESEAQVKIRIEDLSPSGLRLFDGRIVNISDKFREIIYDAAQEDSYKLITGAEKVISLYNEGYVYKRTAVRKEVGEDNILSRRSISFKKLLKAIVVYLKSPGANPSTISDSGKIDMILRRSEELGISSKEYILNFSDEIVHQFGRKVQTGFVINYKDILNYDYADRR